MRALLLSAGLGTRLRPLTLTTPKCLIPIYGVPLLDHWLAMLLASGIERVLINTHHLADADLVHEPGLLGTGGTILANRDYFGGRAFLVAHSDNLTWFDVGAFIARHDARPPKAMITMMTFETDTPQSCGIVEQDAEGIVIGFHEKVANPPGRRANGAVYIFEPAVIAFMVGLGKPVLDICTEVLPHFLGRMITSENRAYHRDIGTQESLNKAHAEYPEVFGQMKRG